MALKKTDYDGLEELKNYSIKKEYFSKLKKEITTSKPSPENKLNLNINPSSNIIKEEAEPLNVSADKLLYKLNIDTDKETQNTAKEENSQFAKNFSSNNDDDENQAKDKKSIFWIILIILLIIAIAALYFLFINNSSSTAKNTAQQEQAYANQQDRLNKINSLPLEESRRQALRSKQIFMGASFEQVKLALGSPSKVINTEKNTEWHYINNGKLETKVIFKDGKVNRGTRY